jgi:peptidoglycan-N-acetylglucosamine deacetylase
MVRAVRKWRTPRSAPRLLAITEGARRRRRPRLAVIAVIAVLVALGVAAVVLAASHTQTATHRAERTAGFAAEGPRRQTSSTERRELARESRAIDAALRYTPFVTQGLPRQRVMALSFDDGPSPYTPEIVRILVRMKVHATFFIVGQQLDYFSAALRGEVRYGFTIGDHTENHSWLIRLSSAAQYGQIHDDATRVERLGAPFPRLFRPPYGAYNRQTLAILHKLKMMMVMWSIDPGDWRRPGTKAIIANVLANARPGAIVILHDGGGDRSQTVAALPAIVNGLRRRHYRLVTVPQLLMADPPPRHQPLPHLFGV